METKFIYILVALILVAVIIGAYFIAMKKELKCEQCGSSVVIKTGNTRKLHRPKGAIFDTTLPDQEIEYQCQKCKYTFWSILVKI